MALFISPIYTCLLLYISVFLFPGTLDGIALVLCSELGVDGSPPDCHDPSLLHCYLHLVLWIEMADVGELKSRAVHKMANHKHRPDPKYPICKLDVFISGLRELWDICLCVLHNTGPVSCVCSSCLPWDHFWAWIPFSILPTHSSLSQQQDLPAI